MIKAPEDRIILKPIPPETVLKSGLFIPLEAQKVIWWEVVAIGPHVANRIKIVGDKVTVFQDPEIKLEPGMLVLIGESVGIEFEDKGEKFKVIRHSSVELYDDKK